MFDIDLLLSFAFMALLFLRQIFILKQPNKINYAPLMLGIGAIGAVVHFIIHPEVTDMFLTLKESFIPILVSLLLYIIMNILHQTQKSQLAREKHQFTKALVEQIKELKEYSLELEKKMILNQNEDKQTQSEIREKFKHDIKALEAIQTNQAKFLDKFEQLDVWHEEVIKSFENFTEVQLPSLDNIVHKHIDIFRIAEQDHFNKVKTILERAVDSRGDVADEIAELKNSLEIMSSISQTIANTIVRHTTDKLSEVTRPFEKEMLSLKSHTESVNTSLYEGENKLGVIKEQSELIMKQMILSSKKMSELQTQNSSLHDIYTTMRDLVKDIEVIKSEYVKSQSQLSNIIKDFKDTKEQEKNNIREQIESLSADLTNKIENSLEKLHSRYSTTSEDISQSVKFLSKQAQLKNRYSDLDS
ncbi:MAG: hypothetical protein A2513_07755 [Sulfurimonas sp. RIFOXYD12_FULL_33_39]|uniref:hypothetical protein n=1 Tax=unclassified Sulfurimonas TaxID=2623549 RepID=UPI0008CEE4C1|nr:MULTISPECIES: hypothetical protein [unclassified Sulfurimonas]OHE09987.1 MAG: hypothetical protein A2513_07755 [Sulfurimonas sp. RIFOXYD12_FULL_33_39]OHE14793.1 MAG: hypothetical protein A2530_02725 [Sulfurimonas sp. RIFOXYD2_FULL_34_21]